MNIIVVQISPKRFVVAEGAREEYKICTKKMTRNEALEAANELRNLDTRDYSEQTNRILLEEK